MDAPAFPLLEVLCLLGVLAGIVGVVVPVLPGLALAWGSVLVWTLLADDAGQARWVVLALCTVWAAAGTVVKYAWPGRRLQAAGVPTRSLVLGVAGALLGVVFVPVVGLPLGFVAGVWAAEAVRFGGAAAAWPSTKQALLGAGLAVLVELTAGALVLGTFVAGLLLT